MEVLLYILTVLFLLAGAVLGWVSFYRSRNNRLAVAELQEELDELRSQLRQLQKPQVSEAGSLKRENAATGAGIEKPDSDTSTTAVPAVASSAASSVPPSPHRAAPAGFGPAEKQAEQKHISARAGSAPSWFKHLQQNWMVWLGGLCVALAGIFLVRYSIEQGLLGPKARIFSGISSGLLLHAAAEWLRRKRGPHIALAALAGGGSITLYATLLAALHLYQLISPLPLFVLLALVSVLSMTLALLHGPVLAVLGILGAYVVPILVGSNGGSVSVVLVYVLIVSMAALLLAGHVRRAWLWWWALAGGLLWWLLTLETVEVDSWRGVYLLVLAWLFAALPERDLLLQYKQQDKAETAKQVGDTGVFFGDVLRLLKPSTAPLTFSLLLISIAWGFSIVENGLAGGLIDLLNWLLLPLMLIHLAERRRGLSFLPWLHLLLLLSAMLLLNLHDGRLQALPETELPGFYRFCISALLVFSGASLWKFFRGGDRVICLSLAVMSPPGLLSLSYLLTTAGALTLQWSLLACVLGAFYLLLAARLLHRLSDLAVAWLIIAGHVAYSLAVVMFLRQAGLTLALAVQIISLGWVIRRFGLQQLDLVFKLVVMCIIGRLSFNPWIAEYAARVHWPLWTYGGSALCCLAGHLLLRSRPALQAWASGAFAHLLALFLWVCIRYVLYDGAVFSREFSFTEAVLDMNLFATLALVYRWRERFSVWLQAFCRFYSVLLLYLALLLYCLLVARVLRSDVRVWSEVGETPLLNILPLAFATPALFAWLYRRYFLQKYHGAALLFGALSLFFFISLEIMHLWRGNIRFAGEMPDGELYTYSAVWLLLAVLLILGGVWRYGRRCYRAGMLLLSVVIGKLFLVDMSDLQGLLRVASFMGMGLALIAIAYLYQMLRGRSGQA